MGTQKIIKALNFISNFQVFRQVSTENLMTKDTKYEMDYQFYFNSTILKTTCFCKYNQLKMRSKIIKSEK